MNEPDRQPALVPVPNGRGSSGQIRTVVLMTATALGVYLCYRMAMPFLSALVWALTLAVVFTPVHRWMESKLRRHNLTAAIIVLGVGLLVVVPSIFVGQRLVQQAAKGAQVVTAKVESGDWRRAIETQPRLARIAKRIERQVDLPGTVQTIAAWLTKTATSILQYSVIQGVGFLLTFYLFFYFLRDRHAALQTIRSLSPLPEEKTNRLLGRVSDTICATVYGTLLVAAMQGLLGGLMLWWLGLSAPLLWGVAMAVLAVVPMLGAFVVWVPAALFLALAGSWGKALILTLWGLIVVGGSNNLLYPILVGNRLKLHSVLVLLSVVGGMILFGPAGLILGPVVLTVTAVLLEV